MHALVTLAALTLVSLNPDAGNFELHDTRDAGTAKNAHGAKGSKLEPSLTEAVMKFFVIEKDKGPVKGIVICMTAPDGTKYYTEETDAEGYAETLVPVGKKYEVTYLALGRKDVAATVTVTDEPRQRVKLTLRFKRLPPPPPFVLTGVNFDTAKAIIRPESHDLLDTVYEFMKYKKRARIEISGHTSSEGDADVNQRLSQERADAVKTWLVNNGVPADHIKTRGAGADEPIADNKTAAGREKNRRIEFKVLQ